jgi:hypothetical protein
MRNVMVCAAALALGFAAMHGSSFGKAPSSGFGTGPAGIATPSAAQGANKKIYVPAGTRILIRTIDSVNSSTQKTGYRFSASLETDLEADDVVVAPRGTMIYGRLAAASSAGKMSGSSRLTLELTDIMINGTAYPLLSDTYQMQGQGEGKKTTRKIFGGAGLGALIGGIAGGGAGAAIGAGVGAVTGTAVAASKKGEQLSIPSETLLEFRLQQPASLPVAR